MAPDLNAASSADPKKWDYSTPGSSGYDVPKITYDDPSSRKLRVITIGAGFSGIMMAYQIQKDCENVEHVIYDKNHDIGGTWLVNRYPNCACDIPSHAYTYNFALNPDWPRFFSHAPDIWKYLDKVCEVFDLRKYMTFNTEVIKMEWQEELGQWKVTLKQSQEGKEPRVFEDHCHFLQYASGLLDNFKWPKIPGLSSFKGRVVHTAEWPSDYQAEQWKNDRVAVIGSGASSVQTVPGMQPHVKHMDIFVRTGVWFVQIANNFGQNHEYSAEDKAKFRSHPATLVAHSKDIENQINTLSDVYYSGSEAQALAQETYSARMKEWIKDERLLKGFTPKFGVFCRRITPGDPYMLAIQEPNVDVHFTPVGQITEDGVVGEDGVERKCDTIVCATGFDVTYRPRFPVIGRGGVDLYEKWRDHPEAYLGMSVPDMPNFIMFIGPTWPVENGSVTGPLQSVAHYAISWIKKLQRDHIASLAPKQHVTDAFNAHVQEWYKHTVWKDNCRSWYKDNDTGRINAVWPGSALHYMDTIKVPRWEDYEVKYVHGNNMWAALGMGNSMSEKNPDASKVDYSRYLSLENVDPRWLEAHGSTVPKKGESEGVDKGISAV